MMREGFGPGELRARARGCTCRETPNGTHPWDVSSCMMHSGLYGGSAQIGHSGMSWENEQYERLVRTYGKDKAEEIWVRYSSAPSRMPEEKALAWAEQVQDRVHPGGSV